MEPNTLPQNPQTPIAPVTATKKPGNKMALIFAIIGAAVAIVIFVIIFIFMSAVGHNSSPEAVAKEMATRLSKQDYKNIAELVNVPKNAYVDSKAFADILENKSIDLAGDKTIKVVDKTATVGTSKTVKILHDDNRVLSINTEKVDGKWYVDFADYFDKNLVIKVPAGSVAKLNDIVIDKKYKTVETINDDNQNFDFKYDADVYTFPAILSGSYSLLVTIDGGKSYTKDISSDNYDDPYVVLINTSDTTSTTLIDQMSAIFKKVVDAKVAGSDFSTVSNYYAAGDGSKNDPKIIYADTIVDEKKASGYSHSLSNITISNFKTKTAYIYGKNLFYISGSYSLSYKESAIYNQKYDSILSYDRDSKYTKNFTALLEKTGDAYVIKSGTSIVPLNGEL